MLYKEENKYMKCPFCGASDTKVVDTRTMEDNSVIRRRRFCPECSERFTTYERVDMKQENLLTEENY